MKTRQTERGMTLVELSVTVAILGILSALALPNLTGVVTRSEDIRDITAFSSQVKLARALARSELKQVDLILDSGDLVVTPNAEAATRYPLGENIASVTIASFDGSLRFLPDGGTTEANPTLITITCDSGRTSVFRVYPAIGSMRMD